MFSCCARGPEPGFFRARATDAFCFARAFPRTPLAGMYANGEIGPQALAEAPPRLATLTGNAALQGFTAVFALFSAPARKAPSALLCASDRAEGGMAAAASRWLTARRPRLAALFHEQGTAAFRRRHFREAAALYGSGAAFGRTAAEGAGEAEAGCRHVLLANRAAALLEAGEPARALQAADACVACHPWYGKGYVRRVRALEALGRPAGAVAEQLRALLALEEEQRGGAESAGGGGAVGADGLAGGVREAGGAAPAGPPRLRPTEEQEQGLRALHTKVVRMAERQAKAHAPAQPPPPPPPPPPPVAAPAAAAALRSHRRAGEDRDLDLMSGLE
jgi:hypothetical protein